MIRPRAVAALASLAALAVRPAAAQAAPNAWRSGPEMPIARGGAGTATLQDGRVLMIGGDSAGKSVDAYSPSSNSWVRRRPARHGPGGRACRDPDRRQGSGCGR